MEIRPILKQNREEVNEFIKEHWFSTDMVVRAEIVDMTVLEGFILYENKSILGLIMYRINNNECEIMSLDSVVENMGIGMVLVDKIIEVATKENCTKIKLITTNDNINAIRFYQKRGFDMVHLYHNALDISRKLKSSIPNLGDFDIPLKHEIEFEMILKES